MTQSTNRPTTVDFKVGGVLVDEKYATLVEQALAALLAQPQTETREPIRLDGAPIDRLVCLEIRPDVTSVELERALEPIRQEIEGRIGKNRVVQAVELALVEGEPKTAPNSVGAPTAVAERLGWRRDDSTGKDVTVAVLDSAIYPNAWLAGSYLVSPADAWVPDDSPVRATHCTAVAGLVLQHAPAATLQVVPILNERLQSNSCEVAEAVSRLAGTVDIINMSFGCYTEDDEAPLALEMAIEALRGTRTVAVAAGGNGGDQKGLEGRKTWPAALSRRQARSWPGAQSPPKPDSEPTIDFLVSVGALDKAADRPAGFSSTGDWVQLWAPGTDVLAPFIDFTGWVGTQSYAYNGWVRWSGSSLAAAGVTGRIAAELSRLRSQAGTEQATPREALSNVLTGAVTRNGVLQVQ